MPGIEVITLRAQATRDAQTTIAATWLWEEKTVAEWNTALDALNTKKVAVSDLDADQLAARAAYEPTIEALHELTVEGLALARVKWRKDPARKKILSKLSAIGGGRENVQGEAQAWESVWEKFDDTWAPTATNTIAAFRALITSSDDLEDVYKQAHTDWRKAAEELQVQADELWADCVAWYAAATTVFKAGTAIGDMIRGTIGTGSPTPVPEYYEIATAEDQGGGAVNLSYVPGGGSHATTLLLMWRNTATESVFTSNTPLLPNGQLVNGLTAGATYEFKTRAQNSTGSVDSPGVQVTLS